MKVMISLPMNGRKDEDVKNRIYELKEKFSKLHIDVINSYLTSKVENSNNPGVYYLGRTLMYFMHDVDAVYFDTGWEKARGCRIERKICEEYNIKILDKTFFEQPPFIFSELRDNPKIMWCNNIDQHIPRID